MTVSRFTPSLMPRETLERVFVARDSTLDVIKKRIAESAVSESRHHTLLVGPRGSGKTHLISLAYYAARDLVGAGERLQLSWLPEDPWTIISYRQLLAAIIDRLESTPTAPSSSAQHRPDESELEAHLVRATRQSGPVVVFVENLDQILDQLGDLGQQRLRHLLQGEDAPLFIATTTRLDRHLSDQAYPFYGFFSPIRLDPFTVEQAQKMLQALARENGEQELVDHLGTARAIARLRTIAHLAGGQPRMWATLSTALSIDRLDSLVDLLLTRFDDLTPYYQERLGRLSRHERLVVADLAEADRPLHVADLAARLGLDQRSLGKTMSDLADRGWVAPVSTPVADLLDGRRTYYELAEPLVRLAFQIKESRGEPLRLVVDFLKGWFDPDDVARAASAGSSPYLEMAVSDFDSDAVGRVVRQLTRLPATRAPALDLLGEVEDAVAALATDDAGPLLGLNVAVRSAVEGRLQDMSSRRDDAITLRLELHRLALDEMGDVPHPAGVVWMGRAERLESHTSNVEALLVLHQWQVRGWAFTDAQATLVAASSLLGSDHPDILTSRNNLAYAYESAGDLTRAIPLLKATLTDRERVLGPDHPDTLTSRNNLAYAYESAGDLTRAIPLFEATLTDRKRVLGADHPRTLTSRNNLAGAYESAGDLTRAIPLYEATLTDYERVLGPDHPDTLTSRNNLAGAYLSAGELTRAIPLYEATLADRERILGPDHPDTLTSRNNLAYAYESAGDLTRAIPLYEATLADRKRVLGPDHPHTIASRANLTSAYDSAGRGDDAERLRSNHEPTSAADESQR